MLYIVDADPKRIGENIAKARAARGLNRSQFARQLGKGWDLVQRWEEGRTVPSADSLKAIAEVLHVSVDELLGSPAPPIRPRLAEFLKTQAVSPQLRQWLAAFPGADEVYHYRMLHTLASTGLPLAAAQTRVERTIAARERGIAAGGVPLDEDHTDVTPVPPPPAPKRRRGRRKTPQKKVR